ncbi:EF-hand domain-containing protein [Streptomyces ochraceiscleroticus]|uniref:EF-hand domain-containing protein n=1 Tax=Streptomyces ochraceiscleroticus TaxID=47761 RepID=A0ABW1ME74_9ACTN|nr:EF-hand domain-containing protein [Streptomyces ochraceiscleroticus]
MPTPQDVPAKDFLNRKIDVCFKHGDQDGDGEMTVRDIYFLAVRIIAELGEPIDSPKSQALLKSFESFWHGVSEVMDINRDGVITPLEWRRALTEGFAKEPKKFEDGFRPLAQALFELCDKDGSGKVTQREFARFQKAFGTTPENSAIAFDKLDRNGSGDLSVDELKEAWREYYTSADPNARGNWLYGDIFQPNIWEDGKAKV